MSRENPIRGEAKDFIKADIACITRIVRRIQSMLETDNKLDSRGTAYLIDVVGCVELLDGWIDLLYKEKV